MAELLLPFTGEELPEKLLRQLEAYLALLLRWNARMNLTAVRDPDQIVTRHFGESLFAAKQLFPAPFPGAALVDIGSGAGFPGIPIKLYAPALRLTLIESKQRKATFLRELLRTLQAKEAEVFAGRAEDFVPASAGQLTVTLRAVEQFAEILPVAAKLVASQAGARLALLIGESQIPTAQKLLGDFHWFEPAPIPLSGQRVLLVGAAR